jgi:hypothetical protein
MTPQLVAFTATGAIVLWCWWGFNGLQARGLRALFRKFNWESPWGHVAEIAVFVITCCILASIIVEPKSPKEALMTGMSWTGLMSKPKRTD